jgi:hypothetical protein
MRLCEADLRCLNAHAHLGNFTFERGPEQAIRHYEAGVGIGELSLPRGFDGLLPWGLIDNRPFLRCMQGFGLCLWRLGRLKEAERVFTRMLSDWLCGHRVRVEGDPIGLVHDAHRHSRSCRHTGSDPVREGRLLDVD